MIDDLLDGNQRFLNQEFRLNQPYYESIASVQQPKVLWIGCSDSRVSENAITDSKPGTIFVHRNVANIVAFNDVNIAAIIQYALLHLKIPDIVICGHYGCGGIAAIENGVVGDYIADWLLIATGAKDKADAIARAHNLSHEEKLDLLAEENVRLQIKHLSNLSLVKSMWDKGDVPRIHGWVYMVKSGEIRVLVDGRKQRV